MKKYNVLKVLGISFIVLVILSWIIPAGTYSSGSYVASGTSPFGLFDLTRIPLIAITNLIQYALVVLVIGGLYGVLNKTGVYTIFVDGIVKKFKGKEKKFLVISVLTFAILSSVSGASFAIFMLVPLFVAVILLLGFNKVSAMLATIGAMLLGNVAATCNSSVAVPMVQYLKLGLETEIIAKIILFVMLVILYVLFVRGISKVEKVKVPTKTKKETKVTKTKETDKKGSKKETTTKSETKAKKEIVIKEEETKEKDIPLYDATCADKKKSYIPLVVIGCIMFFMTLVAMFDWSNLLKVTFFDNIYESVMGLNIGTYPIVKNILGTLSPFGYWTNYEFIMFIILCIPFIAWLYNVKFDDVIDGFVSGAKKMAKPALYVLLASVFYAAMFNNQTGANIFYTMIDFLLGLGSQFNALVVGVITVIGGLLYSDFSSLMGSVATPISSVYTNAGMYPLMGFIMQTLYGLVMFVAPSSMLLLLGLSYFDISYKDWFKTIWKYLLKALLVIILIIIIIGMFL